LHPFILTELWKIFSLNLLLSFEKESSKENLKLFLIHPEGSG